MSVWMVRAGHGGIYAQLWRDTGIVAIRWTFGGRDVRGMNYEQLRDAHARSSHGVGRIGEFCGVPGAPFSGGHDGGHPRRHL